MDKQAEIKKAAELIGAYMKRKGIGLAKLVKKYPLLGSEKTFRDLRAGKTDGYNLENHLENYTSLASSLELQLETGEIELYDTLPAVIELRGAILDAMASIGTDRVVMVDGESGHGKTTAARILVAKYGTRIRMLEATDMWKDSPGAMLDEILLALGEPEAPISGVAKLNRCIVALRNMRRTLIIDEGHHLGPRSMNVVKTLVNKTPGEFVLMGIPAMWAKLHKAAYVEARQLSTNRLSSRVNLVFGTADVLAYLKEIFPDNEHAELRHAAKTIEQYATSHGCMAFVRDVCRQFDGGFAVEAVQGAVDTVLKRKTQKARK